MITINSANGGVNQPIQGDIPFPKPMGKVSGGFGETEVVFTQKTSSIDTEGLVGIPDEEPVRDDPIGQAMRTAFNFPAPAMPAFE